MRRRLALLEYGHVARNYVELRRYDALGGALDAADCLDFVVGRKANVWGH